MNKIHINIKLIVSISIFFLIFQNFNLPKNIFSVLKKNYHSRLVDTYPFCKDESIGFLNFIKNKYKINGKIEIRNYFISPDPSWFFFKSKSNDLIKDKMILIGYEENLNLDFDNRKGYFYGNKSIKKLNVIKNISFDFIKEIPKQEIRYLIFQKLNNDIKIVYESPMINITDKKNSIKVNLKFKNSLINARPIIQFRDIENKVLENLSNIKMIIQNDIDLNNHTIYEKNNNCYLVSKND